MAFNIQLEGEHQVNINGNNVKQEKINLKADDKNIDVKALKDKDMYVAHYDDLDTFMEKLISDKNKLSIFEMLKNDAIEYEKLHKNKNKNIKKITRDKKNKKNKKKYYKPTRKIARKKRTRKKIIYADDLKNEFFSDTPIA